MIDGLEAVLDALSDLSEEIALAVRRARFRFWVGAAAAFGAIISSVVGIVSLFLR